MLLYVHAYCVQFAFQKLESDSKDKDNEILELKKNGEILWRQVNYLNMKVNTVQDHLRQKKVCI